MISKPPEWPPKRLSDYPYVVVRVRCDMCKRSGAYRLARLAAAHGPETGLQELLERLTIDCPYYVAPLDRLKKRKYTAKCEARFPDIYSMNPRPPDLPPGMGGLRVIEGGRESEAAPPRPDDDPPQRKRASG